MDWRDVSNNKREDFNNYINLLMQLEANKQAQYNAGLDSKIEQLMNMKEFDPSAEQGLIDAYLWDKFGIATKDTKAVQINDALDKIDLHRYGTDYSDLYDFTPEKRGAVAKALLGDYDPTRPSFNERIQSKDNKQAQPNNNKNINGAGRRNKGSVAGFEPMGENVSATISKNKNRPVTPKTNADTAELIKALQNANSSIFDNSFLKDIQAQNRANMYSV